ncbi:MAG: hypothetical protein ABSG31_12550 [Tepidisphaeraceae bacterium]
MDANKSQSFMWLYVVAVVASLIAVFGGAEMLRQSGAMPIYLTGAALLGAGCLGLLAILITLPIALDRGAAHASEERRHYAAMRGLEERLQNLTTLLTLISEQQLLSDRAKSVAFRVKDLEAVRRALSEEMSRRDWEAALQLANDIEQSFGYKQEADRVRSEISAHRDEVFRRQYTELLGPVDRQIKAENWGLAVQEAQILIEKYPNDEQIRKLPEEIENRRQMRKQQLRDSWQEAVDRHDVDGSIEILKRLDLYLTPAEADSMAEVARNVFKEKRESLRTRFALAVQERKWNEAIRLGDEIISDFPNTRIAQEVREKMDALRERAGEPEMTPSV